MTFLHKLAQRLARLRGMLAVAILVAACEPPVAPKISSAARLEVSPRNAALLNGQTVDLSVVGLTAAGDTAMGISVNWTANGGTVVDTSTTRGVHHLRWRSGPQLGRYRVWASAQAGSVADTASITVNAVPVATVVVTPSSAGVEVGKAVQLTATPNDSTGAPLTGRVITWAGSDTSKASVDANGLVVGRRTGSVAMTATSEGRSGTATITVTSPVVPVASVSVSPSAVTLTVGLTGQMTATPKDASGTALSGRVVTWGSSSTAVATVNGSGLVTGISAGSAVITATSEGQAGTATVMVTIPPVASVAVTPAVASVATRQTVQLTAIPSDANGNPIPGQTNTWVSSNPAIATVSGNGLVTGVAVGLDTVTATSGGKSGAAVVTVTTASTTWTHEPAGLARISDYGFSTLDDSGWVNTYANPLPPGATTTSDLTAPLSAPKVIQFFYKQGDAAQCGTAPGTLEYDFKAPVTTLYIGTWAKFSSGFSFPGNTPGSEVHFLYGNPLTSASVVVDLRQDGGVELVGSGGVDLWSSAGLYTVGAWTQVELLMDYNAKTVQLWLNGKVVSFGAATVIPVGYTGGGFVRVQVSPTWGGCSGSAPANDSWLWYDHIHVSGK